MKSSTCFARRSLSAAFVAVAVAATLQSINWLNLPVVDDAAISVAYGLSLWDRWRWPDRVVGLATSSPVEVLAPCGLSRTDAAARKLLRGASSAVGHQRDLPSLATQVLYRLQGGSA